MRLALQVAQEALQFGEVPVGAIIVVGNDIVAKARNEKETRCDATAHAELLALQAAVEKRMDWRLEQATMYCTLEPCAMCAGAMVNARLGQLVFGAFDLKAGAAGSVMDVVRFPALNHQVKVKAGVLEEECACLLKEFFTTLRGDTSGRDGRVGRRRSTRNRVGG